jgi:hypothetical protein
MLRKLPESWPKEREIDLLADVYAYILRKRAERLAKENEHMNGDELKAAESPTSLMDLSPKTNTCEWKHSSEGQSNAQ